ncbi:galactose-1-phosphate uridylyltransferase [bacterium]|nr:galactose-1-phosphate uridylyltransferase [bacterium]
MSELRKDPIVSRWVIISEERGKRPSDFPPDDKKRKGNLCPFCEGQEHNTPREVLAYRHNGDANQSGWLLRVVPNKFPALQIEGELNPRGEGMFDLMNGLGAHEVIIETPDHQRDLTDLDVKEFERILWAYRDRIQDLQKDIRFKYILIFKNHGSAAGATVEHTHSQLIATPVVPKIVMEELQGVQKHYDLKERCIYCDMIRQELQDRKRIVLENEHFITLAPFASCFPFELWILPKQHQSHFEEESNERYMHLAELFKETLTRLGRALDHPPYNYVIHTSPINAKTDSPYHWHIEITPKLTKVAGFEWGSGFYINPTPPEQAAEYLRQVKLTDV